MANFHTVFDLLVANALTYERAPELVRVYHLCRTPFRSLQLTRLLLLRASIEVRARLRLGVIAHANGWREGRLSAGAVIADLTPASRT